MAPDPMRIVFIHNLARGGAHRTMSEHFARLGPDTSEVCLGTASPISPDAITVPFDAVAHRLPHVARPAVRYADIARLLRAWHRVSDIVNAGRFDLVVVHPCRFLQAPPALRTVRPATLYFCHEYRRVDYDQTARSTRRARTKAIYTPLYAIERRLDRASVASVGALVTNSRYMASEIQRAYQREAEVIRLGVPDLFLEPSAAVEPRHLLSVASLIPGKGHDLVIESAAAAGRPYPVIIVAPRDDPAERSRLEREASRHRVRLEIRIGVSDEALRDLYRAAFVTLYLARAEPFGLVALEAQACGSPVIVADAGGLPETVLAGKSGWVVKRDPEAVAEAISRLRDKAVRATAVSHAREHGGRFNWDESLGELMQVAGRLMANGP